MGPDDSRGGGVLSPGTPAPPQRGATRGEGVAGVLGDGKRRGQQRTGLVHGCNTAANKDLLENNAFDVIALVIHRSGPRRWKIKCIPPTSSRYCVILPVGRLCRVVESGRGSGTSRFLSIAWSRGLFFGVSHHGKQQQLCGRWRGDPAPAPRRVTPHRLALEAVHRSRNLTSSGAYSPALLGGARRRSLARALLY